MKVEDIGDHMAFTCACGSVHFCLLKSGRIECSSCQQQINATWQQVQPHPNPETTERVI